MMGMTRLRSLTAAFLASALVVLSPGLPCYQAVAAEIEGGAPKGAQIRVIPAVNLPQVGVDGVPNAEIPKIPNVLSINPSAVPAIPALPQAVPGLAAPADPALQEGAARASATEPLAALAAPAANVLPEGRRDGSRPLAESTLRSGAQEIAQAKEGGFAAILSRFWTGSRAKSSDASVVQASSVQDELPSGLVKLSVDELKNIAADQKRSSHERLSAVKAIADRSDDPAKLALEEIGTAKPVGDARDYEVKRQALRALAEKGTVVSLPEISEEHKQQILSDLKNAKPALAVFDYDGTLEKDGDKASPETGAALKAIADQGVKPVILTGEPMKSGEKGIASALESLSTLSAEQKASVSLSSDRGARLMTFNKKGEPKIINELTGWTAREKSAISAAALFMQGAYGAQVVDGEKSHFGDYSYTLYLRDIQTPEALDKSVKDLEKLLGSLKIDAGVSGHAAKRGKPARLLLVKYDKAAGMEAILTRSKSKSAVLVGNDFLGSDAVDSPMAKGAPGALTLAVGGSADPRIANAYVWPTQGHAASMEIARALAVPAPAKPSVKGKVSGLFARLKAKWNEEGPKAPGPDDPINTKTLLGNIIPSIVSMSAYMFVTLAFVGVAVPVVGWTGYGILMSLSPMAGIAAANIMGNVFKKMGARNAMVLNTALQVVSLSALPLFHLFGVVSMGSLLLGALASGFVLSSIMTTSGAFLPALYPSKQIGNINGVTFMMFPLVQVILGIWAHVGRFADLMSPFTIFAGAAALNALIVLPLTWFLIPNTKLSQSQPATASGSERSQAPSGNVLALGKDFVKTFWKPMLALGAAVGLFAGLTWGLPALAAAGFGGKLVAGVAAYLKTHSSLSAPLPIVAALVYWISRTSGFKALKEGKTAKDAAGKDGRQLKAIGLMSLSTVMYYPLYLVAAPRVAEALAGPAGKLELAGQFLGALFFGSLISTVARTTIPSFSLKLPGGRKIAVNTTKVAKAAVVVLAGLFAATKIFAGASLLASVGIGAAAMAVAAGLLYLATRITDRGWIKGAGIGFAAIWLPFVVWTWPALIPFLTVKTAMLLSLLAAGYVNGPTFVSLISYLMGSTERSENSKVTGVQGAFFNAAISTAYAIVTIASGFLSPAYPAVLAVLGIVNLLVGGVFWRSPKHLPGLAPTIFKASEKKPAEPSK